MSAERDALIDEFDATSDELNAITKARRILDAREVLAVERRNIARAALVAHNAITDLSTSAHSGSRTVKGCET